MIPTLSLTRYTILDQLLLSGDQCAHLCIGTRRRLGRLRSWRFFQSGHLNNQVSAEADNQDCEIQWRRLLRRARLSWSPRPHLKRPRPRSQVGLRASAPGPSAKFTTRAQTKKTINNAGASGPQKGPQSLLSRVPSPRSSASPPDCEQPLSTSGKNSPAIFARPTSGPSLGAAPHRK